MSRQHAPLGMEERDERESHTVRETKLRIQEPEKTSSRQSSVKNDAGSVKDDAASDAGSTTTMETTISVQSAGTLASAASTAFYPPQVHFFSLDDFAGHEIHAILEDGAEEHSEDDGVRGRKDRATSASQSHRPGSIVSNLGQRLGDLDVFQTEHQPEPSGTGSSMQHSAEALARAGGTMPGAGGVMPGVRRDARGELGMYAMPQSASSDSTLRDSPPPVPPLL